jgi:hypothetical protein
MEYVRRVQDFLEAVHQKDFSEARKLLNEFWAAFGEWIYGVYPPGDRPKGVLGSILIYQVGRQRASSFWVEAMDAFEENAFTVEYFHRCAAAFCPSEGEFEPFFKRWLTWRAMEVVEKIAAPQRNLPWEIQGMDVDQILPWAEKWQDELPQQCLETQLRRLLGRYGQMHSRGQEVELEVAAFELKYKAYWPVEKMTPATQTILRQRVSAEQMAALAKEYYFCQEQRETLAFELAEAFQNFQAEEKKLHRMRKELEALGEKDFENLEWAASQLTLQELDGRWKELQEEDRCGLPGRRVEYQKAWRRWSLARGKLNAFRLQRKKYEECRLPWIRSQLEVARLLGVSQSTVFRYQNAVANFLREHWPQKPCE